MIPKAPDAIRVTYDLAPGSSGYAARTWHTTDMREAVDLTMQDYPDAYITKMELVYTIDD